MAQLTIGLCRESQPIPEIHDYIFEEDVPESNITEHIQEALTGYDKVTIVFTHFTPELDAVVSYCNQQDIDLTFMLCI